ncbi:TrbC/VirB2 family protein [Sphingomonas sp. CARO-RG-8B-R24-01]|uniref:TrbC/VirB2 family protein n=1 Tax=Sphingomonas sp. CARO-RG-8B-R24-01 TaxID=2914831 RepID=UPI0024129EB2|nr:TrbC/VirB2 family protein [Sphingomonas sp. CARO-RG-8B-R24-01]
MRNLLEKRRKQLDRARYVPLALAVMLFSSPAFADDPTNISNGLTSITAWVKTAAVPIGILAVMGAGFAKMTGRLDWPRFFSVLVGIGIVFGATQIVGWLSGGATG